MTLPSPPEQDQDISQNVLSIWQQAIVSSWQKIRRIIEPLALAIATGFVLSWLKVPVGWLVGSLLVGVAYASIQGNPKPLPAGFVTAGKVIIGLYSAARFLPGSVFLAKNYAVPLVLCILIGSIPNVQKHC
jgi:hypothetical protein